MANLFSDWVVLQLGQGEPFEAPPCGVLPQHQARLFRLIGLQRHRWAGRCWHAKFTKELPTDPIDAVRIHAGLDDPSSLAAEQAMNEATKREGLGEVRREAIDIMTKFKESHADWEQPQVAAFLPIWRDWSEDITTALSTHSDLGGEALSEAGSSWCALFRSSDGGPLAKALSGLRHPAADDRASAYVQRLRRAGFLSTSQVPHSENVRASARHLLANTGARR